MLFIDVHQGEISGLAELLATLDLGEDDMPVTFTCLKREHVLKFIDQIVDEDGFIDIDQLTNGVKRLPLVERQYLTTLEHVDEEVQAASWPPSGRWIDEDWEKKEEEGEVR